MRFTALSRITMSITHCFSGSSSPVAVTVIPSASVPVTLPSPYTAFSTSRSSEEISLKVKVSGFSV